MTEPTTAQAMGSIQFDAPRSISAEDQARADYYALLSHLFYQAPDDRLLHAIAIAEPPGGELTAPWKKLADAASVMPADAIREEYSDLFIGVGRASLMLYGSYYIAGFTNEKPLAELRTDLGALGFSRAAEVSETEDHVAALCDVMRALIVGSVERKPADAAVQREFFMTHINSWIFRCTAEISAYHLANFYRHVAKFAEVFMRVEGQALSMES
jgi:TorA maturation chaperone TorD